MEYRAQTPSLLNRESRIAVQPSQTGASTERTFKPVARPALKFWVRSIAVASCSAAINLLARLPGIFLRGEYQLASNSRFVSSEPWVQQYRVWEEQRDKYLASAAERPCPLCGSWERHTLWDTADGYRYVACDDCRMVYSTPALSDEQWCDFLEECTDLQPITQRLIQTRLSPRSLAEDEERFSQYLWRIGRHMKPGRVLDVGCFTGNFLGVAKRSGYQCTGVEAYREAAEAASAFHGVPVTPGFLAHVCDSLGTAQFDLITMWEALEHVVCPADELRRVHNLLARGGLVALTVPNFDNLHFRVLQDRCFHGLGGPGNPGHMNMFTLATLKAMFRKTGFQVLDIFTECGSDFDELLAFLCLRFEAINSYENIFQHKTPGRPSSSERYTIFSDPMMKLIAKMAPFLHVWEAASDKGGLIFAIAKKL
jgi:2-polyprenyl-3-methyl-5-hydroxy-6-metoxy-1,4-benzoquinol methylase